MAELVVSGLLLAAMVLFHRSAPLTVLCAAVAAATFSAVVLAPTASNPARIWPFAATAVFAYLLGRGPTGARVMIRSLVVVVVAGLPVAAVVDDAMQGGSGLLLGVFDWFVLVLLLLLTVAPPWLTGRYRRQRAALLAAGWERAELLERQQRLDADRARMAERARIAQDMHDVLGHEWALIALRAAALEVSTELDDRARGAARELRADVATATQRLRAVIGVLRPDSEPALGERSDLAALIERTAAAGVVIRWEPMPEPDDVPPMVRRAVYRVVQEALTNAARHAPGAAAAVRVEHSDASTTVRVSNGLSPGHPAAPAADGHGLVGLRERVRLLGGTLHAGPDAEGYAVVAVLPHEAAPGELAASDDAPTGSARGLQQARDALRRRTVTGIRGPVLAGGGVTVLGLALYFALGTGNSLDPATFGRIPVGADRGMTESDLPAFQVVGDLGRTLPAPPSGTRCRYYWSSEPSEEALAFRLCFTEDRLAAKEAIPRSALSGPTRGGGSG